jgi:hypothetical protein
MGTENESFHGKKWKEKMGSVQFSLFLSLQYKITAGESCMARKTRIEYEGACYHVINRGNYRSWIFESPEIALDYAGGLSDTPAGRRKYRDYLGWISETDEEARRLGFEEMTKGWAKGTADFK